MNAEAKTKKPNGGEPAFSLRSHFVSLLNPVNVNAPDGRVFSADCARTDWAGKRAYDVFFSFGGLLVLCPLLAVIAALVKIAGGKGDVFFRQRRVGRDGREFVIYKFRTMVAAAETAGPSITKNGDARVTLLGRFLRRTKIDELPQLWNVLKGDMSLVGPRPEVPRYVALYTPEQRAVLRLKPGITDLASLCFRDEEALLANAGNVEAFYLQHCVPRKVWLNCAYAARASALSDTWIILQTVCPYWISVLAGYGIILAAAYLLTDELIFNFAPPDLGGPHFWRGLGMTLAMQLACLTWHRQCRGLLSFFSFPEARKLGASLGLAAAGVFAWLSIAGGDRPALNFILINALLSFCLLGGCRVLLRCWRERSAAGADAAVQHPVRVGIIGAGRLGAHLALELAGNRALRRQVVAFFDDNFHKWQKDIHDVPVVGMPECLLDGWAEKIDEVVIAMPESAAGRVRELEHLLRKTNLKFYLVGSPIFFWKPPQAA